MHLEVINYLKKAIIPVLPSTFDVVEFGSLNVNGSARDIFPQGRGEWTGVDLVEGPGVDVVADACHYTHPKGVDIVICCEMLEHCSRPGLVISSAWNCLKPKGLLVLTAASPKRLPHSCDGRPVSSKRPLPKGEFYAGIEPEWLAWELKSQGWEVLNFMEDEMAGDVYAIARKP